MKKLIILSVILMLLIIKYSVKAYDEFDNRYHYDSIGGNTTYNRSVSTQDEVLFILDFSASMNKKMGYSPKAYLAIDAIDSILSNSEQYTKIGLRIFGIPDKQIVRRTSRGLEYDEHAICTASKLLIPISRFNSKNISNSLQRINPSGGTPIGYSLRQAVSNDFSAGNHMKHIILITDGEENCGDDPCAFISNLMRTRKDFTIDVIGITVDSNAYSQLNCIANAGGGHYYSVNNPNDFKVKFKQAFNAVTANNQPPAAPQPQITPSYVNPSANNPNIKYKLFSFEFSD